MSIKYVYLFLLFPVVWISAACNRKLDLPDIEGKKSITLLGELVANDSFYLRAGQSLPLASGENLKFEIINNLSVYVSDEQSGIYLSAGEDTSIKTLHTIPFTSAQKVLPLHTYNIVATHSSLGTATASVNIPGPFTATLADTVYTKYSTENVLKVIFRIDDPGNTSDYYVIEALKQKCEILGESFFYNGRWLSIADSTDLYYDLLARGQHPQVKSDTAFYNSFTRRVMYTDDMNTDNALENGIYHRNRRVLLSDKNFNGTSYTSHVYIPLDTASFSLLESGKLFLYVKSVPEKYFRYLKAYESYTEAGGYNTFSQPVKVEGNITNGIGMIGSAYLVRLPLLFDNGF